MILLEFSDWLSLFGRFHPLIVHLPIGIIVVAVVFELLRLFGKYESLKTSIPLLWMFASLSSILSCIAGLLLAEDGGYEDDLLSQHQWAGIMLAILTTAGWFVKVKKQLSSLVSITLACTVAVVLSFTGHLGGSLTHGENYLSEAVDIALGKEMIPVTTTRKPIENIEDAMVYNDLIAPVLEQKCYQCHSVKKQKGELRVDAIDLMMKGGKGGTVLVAGDPSKSELYKRLMLPQGDKKRMPPKGKQQLTKDEILLIEWWIKEGQASADKKVSEIKKPQPVEVMLTSFSNHVAGSSDVNTEIPDVTTPEAPSEAIAKLEARGVRVSKLSPDLPFLSINCINAPDFGNDDLNLLIALQDQIVWLKAEGTQLNDQSMTTLAKLKNLTRLSLANTNITDSGVLSLKELTRLQYLNLVRTKVSDGSVESLGRLENLKSLYLWQSAYTQKGVEKLRKTMPATDINFGAQVD